MVYNFYNWRQVLNGLETSIEQTGDKYWTDWRQVLNRLGTSIEQTADKY